MTGDSAGSTAIRELDADTVARLEEPDRFNERVAGWIESI